MSSRRCDVGGSWPTGKVRVSPARFEYTEPPRITVTKGEAGLQGRLGEFGAVRPQQTSSNHCYTGGRRPTGKVRLVRFDLSELPRTTVM